MSLRDIGASFFLDGQDEKGSLYEHTALLGALAVHQFFRAGRGIPTGYFEEASLRFSPRMTNILRGSRQKTVVIIPTGDIPSRVIDVVCRVCWDVFGLSVRIMRRRTMWPEALVETLEKADAGRVLARLEPLGIEDRVLALTNTELFAILREKEAYVHGYGHMTESVCVVSIHGFGNLWQTDSHMPWARLIKVVVHELGHTFGLRHHDDEGTTDISCIMNTAQRVGEGDTGRIGLDFLTHELCNRCLDDVVAGRSQYAEYAKKKAGEKPACTLEP